MEQKGAPTSSRKSVSVLFPPPNTKKPTVVFLCVTLKCLADLGLLQASVRALDCVSNVEVDEALSLSEYEAESDQGESDEDSSGEDSDDSAASLAGSKY